MPTTTTDAHFDASGMPGCSRKLRDRKFPKTSSSISDLFSLLVQSRWSGDCCLAREPKKTKKTQMRRRRKDRQKGQGQAWKADWGCHFFVEQTEWREPTMQRQTPPSMDFRGACPGLHSQCLVRQDSRRQSDSFAGRREAIGLFE